MSHGALARDAQPVYETAPTDPLRLRRFLQYGHVFSSAIQEVLESRLVAEVSPYPLTVPQFHLLKLIALRGQHQVGEVADLLGVSSPAVSKNVGKLEGLGLVTRSPFESDRRVTLVSASPQGRALVDRYESLTAARLAPVLARFSPVEIDCLTGLLESFSLRLLQAEASGTSFCLRCAAYGDECCSLAGVDGVCPYKETHRAARASTIDPAPNGALASGPN
jgi:DNA-binding MarR family transcriptional regulator